MIDRVRDLLRRKPRVDRERFPYDYVGPRFLSLEPYTACQRVTAPSRGARDTVVVTTPDGRRYHVPREHARLVHAGSRRAS